MKGLLQKSGKYIMVISGISSILALINFFLMNDKGDTIVHIMANSFFFISLMLFCYALMAFVTEQGLFNGIRFSMKHVQATISKRRQYEMMEAYDIDNPQELKQHIKDKILLERPKFDSTYPLLISSSLLLALSLLIGFVI